MMQIKKLKFNQTSKEIGTITEEKKTENKAMPLGFYLLFNSIWNTSARISLLSWDESRKKKKEIRKKYGQFNLNTEQLLGKCENCVSWRKKKMKNTKDDITPCWLK